MFTKRIIPCLDVTNGRVVKGRGKKVSPSPIKALGLQHKLKIHQPNNKTELNEVVEKINPDLVFVVAYGLILPKSITDNYFCVNGHGSLLPNYRGASPIQASLLKSDKTTGITLIKMNEEMDEGDVLLKETIEITANDNYGTLHNKLSELAAKMCINFINNQFLPDQIKTEKQDDSIATYCPKIQKEDLALNPKGDPQEFVSKVKAFSPVPGAFITHQEKRVKILEAFLDNGSIKLIKVKPEGKKEMTYQDYCLGHPEGLL